MSSSSGVQKDILALDSDSDDESVPELVVEEEREGLKEGGIVESDTQIPVTILTGFLGAGKTTLLNWVLTADHGKRIAVIENEFGAGLGIEKMIAKNGLDGESLDGFFELNNGCICCSIKDDLVATLEQLVRHKSKFDYVLIETTGVANPGPVINTFWMDDELGSSLRLDGVVAVIDTLNLEGYLALNGAASGTAQDVRKQIAYADRILLNKADLVDDDKMSRCERLVQDLNPMAECRKTSFSNIRNTNWILNTDSFSKDNINRVFQQENNSSIFQCMPTGTDTEDIDFSLIGSSMAKKSRHSADALITHHFSFGPNKPFLLQPLKIFLDYILFSQENAKILVEKEKEKESKLDNNKDDDESSNNNKKMQIFRIKGILHIEGENKLYSLQACHDIFDIDITDYVPGSSEDVSEGQSRIIVIGLYLNRSVLIEGLKKCLKADD
jgi:G3E family GTPase